jgi:ketosteroid isomerase-like protein
MAAADNASVLRAVYDAANAKDMEKVASYATPDAQDFMVPFEMKGGFRENWDAWAQTFPDGMIEVKTLVAEGPKDRSP